MRTPVLERRDSVVIPFEMITRLHYQNQVVKQINHHMGKRGALVVVGAYVAVIWRLQKKLIRLIISKSRFAIQSVDKRESQFLRKCHRLNSI